VLWGCDIEEVQPHLLIRDLAALNPRNEHLRAAVQAAGSVYQRRTAPTLLQHVRAAAAGRDRSFNGVSLRSSLIRTLESRPTGRLAPRCRHPSVGKRL